MDVPALVPLEYRGELVALVSPERFHIVSPRLAGRPAGDAELRFVALMCACSGRALANGLAGQITAGLVEASTRRALIDAGALASVAGLEDEQAARVLNVPTEQVRLARTEVSTPSSPRAPNDGEGARR